MLAFECSNGFAFWLPSNEAGSPQHSSRDSYQKPSLFFNAISSMKNVYFLIENLENV
jgi:hypothetical protein